MNIFCRSFYFAFMGYGCFTLLHVQAFLLPLSHHVAHTRTKQGINSSSCCGNSLGLPLKLKLKSSESADEHQPSNNNNNKFFNGGKMYHIFKPIGTRDSYQYDPTGTCSSPEAEEALLYGTMYYKIDGSNGMIQVIRNENNLIEFKLYQRYDTRGKKDDKSLTPNRNPNKVPLPAGLNPNTYPGHSYFYDEIRIDNIPEKQKNLLKKHQTMHNIVKNHANHLISFGREWISIEWVGTKINQTPNVNDEVAIAIHEEQIVDPNDVMNIDRTYEGIRKFLIEDCKDQPVEGLVFEHNGRYWKVISGNFYPAKNEAGEMERDLHNPFYFNRKNGRPPIILK